MSIKLGKLKIGGKRGISIGGHSVNPVDAARDVLHQVEHAANEAVHHIEGEANTVLHEVEGAANTAVHEVSGAAQKGLHEIEGAADKALHEIENGLINIRDEIFKKLAGLTIGKAIGVLEATLPDVFTLTIGPFAFSYEDPAGKIDTLKGYAQHPPGLGQVSDLVLALSPTTVSVSLSAELAFLLVSSDSLAVGFEAEYEVENFIGRYDAIRKQLGI